MSTFDAPRDVRRAGILHSVMTRVATEPRPTPSRAFLAALRRGSPTDAFTALATAWRLATLRDRPIALGARVRAAGLALGVGGLLASSGAVAIASVAGVANDVATRLSGPSQIEPERPAPMPSASPSAHPVLAMPHDAEPSATPSLRAATPEPSSSTSASPKPARTPRPTSKPHDSGGDQGGSDGTPRPTARPSSGEDGGSGGDGSGGDGAGSSGGGSGENASSSPDSTDAPGDSPNTQPDGG